jgi:hypothetical protein
MTFTIYGSCHVHTTHVWYVVVLIALRRWFGKNKFACELFIYNDDI